MTAVIGRPVGGVLRAGTAREPWAEDARCATSDVEMYPGFIGAAQRKALDRAKELCFGCPVLRQCREWAMRNAEPFGVWGGMTVSERKRLRR